MIKFSSKKSPGFTLLEILIVITIISILVTAAVPNLRHFYIQTVQEDATRNVATVLRRAQNMSIIHRRQMQVQFDLGKNEYQIIPDPEMIEDEKILPRYARSHELPEGVGFKKIEFNTDEFYDSENKIRTINFYPNGSSDGGQIEISGTKMQESTLIEIKQTTGNIIVTTSENNET